MENAEIDRRGRNGLEDICFYFSDYVFGNIVGMYLGTVQRPLLE